MSKLFTTLPIKFSMPERLEIIKEIRKDFINKEMDIKSGYHVSVKYQFNNVKVKEEGLVVDIRGNVFNKKITIFTKRKMLFSIYVNSINYDITVLKTPKKAPRRKKLSYLYKPKK